jgi:hypothetical protein
VKNLSIGANAQGSGCPFVEGIDSNDSKSARYQYARPPHALAARAIPICTGSVHHTRWRAARNWVLCATFSHRKRRDTGALTLTSATLRKLYKLHKPCTLSHLSEWSEPHRSVYSKFVGDKLEPHSSEITLSPCIT